MAGFLAPNIAKNTLIPHGVSMLFKRTGDTYYTNLGDLSDISITPTIEFLEYSTNRFAKSAIAKRIGQNKAITIEATINEVAPETLRIAFFGQSIPAQASVTDNVMVERFSVGDISSASQDFELAFAPNSGTSGVDQVTYAEADQVGGKGEAHVSGTDYSVSGTTLTINTGAGIASNRDIIVTYQYTEANANTIEIGKDDQQTGEVQFHIRNNEGGLGQRITLGDVHIAASGAIPIAPDAVQNFPITVTALVKNGKLGDFTFYDA